VAGTTLPSRSSNDGRNGRRAIRWAPCLAFANKLILLLSLAFLEGKESPAKRSLEPVAGGLRRLAHCLHVPARVGCRKASKLYNSFDENPFTRAIGTNADLGKTGQNTRRTGKADRFLDPNPVRSRGMLTPRASNQARFAAPAGRAKKCLLEGSNSAAGGTARENPSSRRAADAKCLPERSLRTFGNL
jgi:hypothetical protein